MKKKKIFGDIFGLVGKNMTAYTKFFLERLDVSFSRIVMMACFAKCDHM